MDPPAAARALAVSLLALVVTGPPLAAVGRGMLLRLAGPRPIATASLFALASLALGATATRWRHGPLVALGLAAAALAGSQLPLHAVIPGVLGRLDAVPFGVNAELFAELYAASAVGAAFSVGAALAASLRGDALRPAALALALVGAARAFATGASALALHAEHVDAPARLGVAALAGWGGVVAGAAVLAWAMRSPASRVGAVLVAAMVALALAFDESALGQWGAVGRPDLTEGLRLPLLRGKARVSPRPAVHLVVSRGLWVAPGGRRLPLAGPALAAWMARAAARHPPPAHDEGGDFRCAGGATQRAELVVAAEDALPPATVASIVAAAEEASVSTLTFVARVEDAAPGDTPRVRLPAPAVTAVSLLLRPMQRACPRPTARARVTTLPALPLDALLRAHGARSGEVVHEGGVLFTAGGGAPTVR